MPEFQRTITKPKRTPSLLLIVFLTILLLILISSVWQLLGKRVRLQTSIKQLELERAALLAKKDHVANAVSYLGRPEGREQALKEKYGLVAPGEGLVVIVDPAIPEETVAPDKPSIFKRFFLMLGNIFSKD